MSSSSDSVFLHGVAVSATSLAAVEQLRCQPDPHPGFLYPWDGLENFLATSSPNPELPLIGYGSLLQPASALRTLKHPVSRNRVNVMAFGVRRVFNYAMSDATLANYGPSANPRARAALNAYPTGDSADVINGVRVPVDLTDIQGLRQREQGYNLAPVWCLRWDHLDQQPVRGYVLCCPDEPRAGVRQTDDSLLPHEAYFHLCRAAAAEVSAKFLRFFLETTFLGDRQTRLDAWEESLAKRSK